MGIKFSNHVQKNEATQSSYVQFEDENDVITSCNLLIFVTWLSLEYNIHKTSKDKECLYHCRDLYSDISNVIF